MNYILFSMLYLCVDLIWISIMSKLFYTEKIQKIQKQELTFKYVPAILAYITLLIIMFYICIPLSKYYKQHHPSLVFGLVGFCVYGVYNFTNGAIFTNYDSLFIIIDTLWGLVSFALFGLIYNLLK
jgi:uncharacterized membrane protein